MIEQPPGDSWERGDPYERYVGRWSRIVAPRFLDWLAVPPGRRWVDVGCGTGALIEAILARCAPSEVTGIEPSAGFLETARRRLGGGATLLSGDATAIPLPGEAADAVVSALVMNFVPDPRAALLEMRRIARPGGTIAGYVWDYAEGMQMIRAFWDAAVELDRGAEPLDERARFPLCQRDALGRLFTQSGLLAVDTTAVVIETAFANFDDFWQPFLGGQGPAPSYLMSLAEPARDRLRDRLRSRLLGGPTSSNDGAIVLTARAWAVRGTVP